MLLAESPRALMNISSFFVLHVGVYQSSPVELELELMACRLEWPAAER